MSFPLIVFGNLLSCLVIKFLCTDHALYIIRIDFTENEGDSVYREKLEALAKEKGAAYLHGQLAMVDPKSAEEIHANNKSA